MSVTNVTRHLPNQVDCVYTYYQYQSMMVSSIEYACDQCGTLNQNIKVSRINDIPNLHSKVILSY